MPEDFDIPDIPDVDGADAGAGGGGGTGGSGTGGGRGPASRRRWPWLMAGLVVGVAGALLLPRFAGPYLPDTLRPDRLRIGGEVLKKRAEAERLLLTVETDSGAMLATFRRRVSAIDLLVEPGDSVTLSLERYRPFVEDPGLHGVRKGRAGAGPRPAPDTAPAGAPAEPEPGEADAAAEGAGREPGTPAPGDTSGDTATSGGGGPDRPAGG